MTTDTDRALEQAKAQYEAIKAMVERLEHARECDGGDACTLPPAKVETPWTLDAFDQYHDEEDARQVIQDDPLSVEVRSGWRTLDYTLEAEEFQILLCWGGPAVRIMGELDEYHEPYRAWLEYQDWGTGWTQWVQLGVQDTLLAYAREFYFGG